MKRTRTIDYGRHGRVSPRWAGLAVAIVLAGCDAEAPEPLCVGLRVHDNGVMLNALMTNGLMTNGVPVEGTTLRGVALANAHHGDIAFPLVLDAGRLRPATGPGDDPSAVIGATIPARTELGEVVGLEVVAVDIDDQGHARYVVSAGGVNPCGPTQTGMFVAGVWDDTGARADATGSLDATYSCDVGVISKCVTWGYDPDAVGADLHATCTRLARADYCGDGIPHTANGTPIDVFDAQGVLVPDDVADLDFEAGWGPNGAVCVAEPRYHVLDEHGDEQLPPCWDALPRCETPEQAFALGATIVNRSEHTVAAACGR